MKTVGEILKSARKKNKLSIDEVSQATKINKRYISAIEANQFSQLPPSAFTKGFLKNYAKLVDINPEQVLAIFRRDYDFDDRGRIIPRGLTQPPPTNKSLFQPRTLQIASISLIAVLVFGFFIFQIIQFNSPPPLHVLSPVENQEVQNPVIISGNTDPQATLKINNRTISLTQDGSFQTEISLTPGQHSLIIESSSRSNKSTTIIRNIFVNQ